MKSMKALPTVLLLVVVTLLCLTIFSVGLRPGILNGNTGEPQVADEFQNDFPEEATATSSAWTVPGVDLPGATTPTPIAVGGAPQGGGSDTVPGSGAPTGTPPPVAPGQLPTTGAWGLPFDLARFMPQALRRMFAPPPAPAPQGWAVVGRLIIPALGVDTQIIEVPPLIGLRPNGEQRLLWEIPDDGAGYLGGTAGLGQAGNAVISGHNNIGSMVFAQLEEMHVGDQIFLYPNAGGEYVYTVQQVLILPEDGQSEATRLRNTMYVAPMRDTRLTLISCWPDWTNTERVIVVALP